MLITPSTDVDGCKLQFIAWQPNLDYNLSPGAALPDKWHPFQRAAWQQSERYVGLSFDAVRYVT